MTRSQLTHEDKAFLSTYDPATYERPAVTVDLVILTILDDRLVLLLVQRNEPPYRKKWALPGGFVRVGNGKSSRGEDLLEAAQRELSEETGLPTDDILLAQIGAFGAPMRDPRMRVVSIAYAALVRPTLAPFIQAGGDAARTEWTALNDAMKMPLAFDHPEIASKALQWLRDQLVRSSIARSLLPPTFSIAELRRVHEAILDVSIDPGNFRKRFLRMIDDSVIEQAPGRRITASKPASVYRFVDTGRS